MNTEESRSENTEEELWHCEILIPWPVHLCKLNSFSSLLMEYCLIGLLIIATKKRLVNSSESAYPWNLGN